MIVKSILCAGLVLALAVASGACRVPPKAEDVSWGVRAAESGRWDEAAVRWRKALDSDPSSVAAHNNLAVAYEKSGRLKEARKEYEAALRLDPGNSAVQENFRKFKESHGLEAGEGNRRGRPPKGETP
jgi:Tfp pilus assembly protein PilF